MTGIAHGPVVIVCTGMEGGSVTGGTAPVGQYLASYDPDAHGGLGFAEWTADPGKAMVFAEFIAAFECWRATSTVLPRRPYGDHGPNRPLTAFTVEFVSAAEAGASG